MAQESIDPTTKPYIPVDTDLVDNLEHYALDKIRVEVDYLDRTNTPEQLHGLIAEIYTKDHAEFMKMVDGRTLRLDQIKKVTPKHN